MKPPYQGCKCIYLEMHFLKGSLLVRLCPFLAERLVCACSRRITARVRQRINLFVDVWLRRMMALSATTALCHQMMTRAGTF